MRLWLLIGLIRIFVFRDDLFLLNAAKGLKAAAVACKLRIAWVHVSAAVNEITGQAEDFVPPLHELFGCERIPPERCEIVQTAAKRCPSVADSSRKAQIARANLCEDQSTEFAFRLKRESPIERQLHIAATPPA